MGETQEWSSLGEEQRPKFYMIVHNSIIQDGSFELPAKFVKKIEKDLDDDGDGVAVLKVPSGVEWRVKMTRESDAGVWFRNGIRTFVNCYSISAGHFLFFRYDGNSQFHVVIFNMKGSEIEYHLFEDNNDSSSEDNHSNEAENMECFEIQDSQEEDVDHMETLSGDSSSPDRDGSDEDNDEDEVAKKKPLKLTGSKRKNRSLSSSNAKEYVVRANEIERSFASTSTNPFFRIIVQTSYVEHKYMPIPWTFIRYFPDDLKDVKVVAVSDRREWKIRILRSKTDLKLSKGVADFMNKKNGLNLKVGDVLVFEIVKRRYLVLKVHVFPAKN
ncbi:B3 domain-containing transcription factor VRN1-like [Papaver somniferum]|uniref:B3 domain-containing transcription factor VRN1-like n=1 Tax=Papaver somniferum TaxID=3469 RepID=UPI000E6FA466|nr:B3 domain-containing transcription factor VRN1-like [Papaver somniferum]